MTHHEIIKKLIGEIKPIGETNEDSRRIENLSEAVHLVDCLLTEIREVAQMRDRHEYSVNRMAQLAFQYLNGLKNELNEEV